MEAGTNTAISSSGSLHDGMTLHNTDMPGTNTPDKRSVPNNASAGENGTCVHDANDLSNDTIPFMEKTLVSGMNETLTNLEKTTIIMTKDTDMTERENPSYVKDAICHPSNGESGSVLGSTICECSKGCGCHKVFIDMHSILNSKLDDILVRLKQIKIVQNQPKPPTLDHYATPQGMQDANDQNGPISTGFKRDSTASKKLNWAKETEVISASPIFGPSSKAVTTTHNKQGLQGEITLKEQHPSNNSARKRKAGDSPADMADRAGEPTDARRTTGNGKKARFYFKGKNDKATCSKSLDVDEVPTTDHVDRVGPAEALSESHQTSADTVDGIALIGVGLDTDSGQNNESKLVHDTNFDNVVTKNRRGRLVKSAVTGTTSEAKLSKETGIDSSAKKTTPGRHLNPSAQPNFSSVREWAMTKDIHEKRRASDLSNRLNFLNRKAQTLIIGDSHMHGIRGAEISPTVHIMVAGGLCFHAAARSFSETRNNYANFRMVYVALGTNDFLHHSVEEIKHGLSFLLEQLKRVFPTARVEFILPFVSPKLRSLGFESTEFFELIRSTVGSRCIHANVDISGHLDYFYTDPRKPGPAVHLKREHGVGLMINLIKGIMGISQPIAKTKEFTKPAPTPSRSFWSSKQQMDDLSSSNTGMPLKEDFPPIRPSNARLESITLGQLFQALGLSTGQP